MIQKNTYGVLVLHGFTCYACVSPLHTILNELKLPYDFPVLRGHGDEKWEELIGVKNSDWFNDGEEALKLLLKRCKKVIIVGHSMGALVGINLVVKYKEYIKAVVLVSTALIFQNKLAFLSPYLKNIIKTFPTPKGFSSNEMYRKNSMAYVKFPTDAFVELYRYSKYIRNMLNKVECDALIIHSKNDKTAKPKSAKIIYEKISSNSKQLIWLNKSGHEVFLDIEANQAINDIDLFIKKIINKSYEK